MHDIIVNTYYVDSDSVGRTGIPALRRKSLGTAGGAPDWSDQEIISGVEDLQVQFGIDNGRDANNDGIPDDTDGNGLPDSYTGVASAWVNANAVPATALIVSVRFWLMVRSETAEQGFRDTRAYTYADRVNYQPNDNFRRLLVSRTIQLRNTLSIGP